MKIKIWKPGEKGNPCARHYYYQFFQRRKRHRGVLEARNAEQAKQAAQQIWDEQWNKKYDPEPPTPVRISFAAFVKETYLPWAKIHKGSYEDDVRVTTMLTDFFKGKNVSEIKPAMIEQFKQSRIKAGKAPATVNRELSVLSKLFTMAVRSEKAELNPCQNVERFALDNERVRYLTEDEEKRLFAAMGDNEQLKSIATVALHTGNATRRNL